MHVLRAALRGQRHLMQLKKPARWKHAERSAAIRAHQDQHPNVHAHAHQHFPSNTTNISSAPAEPIASSDRGLKADVLFFVDNAIAIAVAAVERGQALRSRLSINTGSGVSLHISIASTGEGENHRFIAYNNDMCLFVGSSPTLYVVNQTAHDLEHSIHLFVAERLRGEHLVSAQIFRETSTVFELPILEGSSHLGPSSMKPRRNGAASD